MIIKMRTDISFKKGKNVVLKRYQSQWIIKSHKEEKTRQWKKTIRDEEKKVGGNAILWVKLEGGI